MLEMNKKREKQKTRLEREKLMSELNDLFQYRREWKGEGPEEQARDDAYSQEPDGG